MILTAALLRELSEVLQNEAGEEEPGSHEWAIFQDAADAVADAADLLEELDA